MILLQEKLIWRSALSVILILYHHNFLAFSTGWFSIYFLLLLRDSENDLLVNEIILTSVNLLKNMRRGCSLFFFSCVPCPCLVPFSFRLNIERKTDCQQSRSLFNPKRFLNSNLLESGFYRMFCFLIEPFNLQDLY